MKVGYKYSYGGLFWIDFWTWDGTYCLFQGDKFQPISAEQAAQLLGKSPDALGTPFLYRFPLGLLILGGFLLLGLISVLSGKAKPDDAAAKTEGSEYERAG